MIITQPDRVKISFELIEAAIFSDLTSTSAGIEAVITDQMSTGLPSVVYV